MTVVTESDGFCTRPARRDVLGAMRAGWQAFLTRRQQRRSLVRLSQLPPHLVRDMGYDPEQIYYALTGSWDDDAPALFGLLLPKGPKH